MSAPALSPVDFRAFVGESVPDPITFVVGEQWLDRPQLYPRQATIIKLIFLRLDLFTDYDYEQVAEWEQKFREDGEEGIVPGVLERARYLRDRGFFYFREVLLVMGRRAGKGYVSALCMAYVIWSRYLALGDPQQHYGVMREKQLAVFVYGVKKEQARLNLWADLNAVLVNAPCFERYICRSLTNSLTLYSPGDFARMERLRSRGIRTFEPTFLIAPKEATPLSGRGPAACILGFDEFAHVGSKGAAFSAADVWTGSTPALDQFKKNAFIIEPSSPWSQVGQFYDNACKALAEDDEENPEYPSLLLIQLPSWDTYTDYEFAHKLPLLPRGFTGDLGEYVDAPLPRFPELKVAIQEYDEEMKKEERANPDTFRVERRARWQTVTGAYLDPAKVDLVFENDLTMKTSGALSVFYKGHADPSIVNANFAVAIAHPERDDQGQLHCVFDYINAWRPQDFEGHTIDYPYVEDELWKLISGFHTDEFTFDQYQSQGSIQKFQQKIRDERAPKRMLVYEQTAHAQRNWERAENFKVSINQEWVHAPEHDLARQELKFLQLVLTQAASYNRVEKQDTGPVTTKDIADCMMECVWTILGDQVHSYTHGALSDFQMRAGLMGGINPYGRETREDPAISKLVGLTQRQRTTAARGGARSPARNPHRPGRRG